MNLLFYSVKKPSIIFYFLLFPLPVLFSGYTPERSSVQKDSGRGIRVKEQDNLIFSSDGATLNRSAGPETIRKCIRAAVRQGKGYEFYIGTAQGRAIQNILTPIGKESYKIIGF